MGLWSVLKQVWTIARHSVIQALRMKIVLVVIAFLAVLLLAMPFLLKSDNTHGGQARMVITYSIYLISFLLSVLTLFLSVATLWTEIQGRQILLLDPKPMSRATLLLGKWLGVMLINGALLATMLLIAYGLVVFYVGRRWRGEPQRAYESFKANVFEARRTVRPALPDGLAGRVDEIIEELKAKDLMPKTQSERYVRNTIRERLARGAWSVAPNTSQKWVLRGIPKFDGWLVVKFRHFSPTKKKEYYVRGGFIINESAQPVVRVTNPRTGAYRGGRPHTFAVTSRVVGDDGTVEIRYANYDEDRLTTLFPYVGGIEVMYPASGLLENFIRAGFVILCRLAFLAILGIFASTFLSFPVGVLLTLTVYIVGLLRFLLFSKMLPNLYLFGTSAQPPWANINRLDTFIRNTVGAFFMIFPNFSAYDVAPALSNGIFIETGAIFNAFFWLTFLRGGVLAFCAWLIFRRRQLAAFSPNA